ncbi:MAG TPA: hypothetical protein VJ783_02420 [Pirellulales bacterium]|nr:hypothetical protein [Pirellulales bacterium]
MARCVRRAFLCGFDRSSGRNFDHRKVWVRQRLEELAGIVAVDVDGTPAEPEPHELAMLLADAEALATRRKRLSSKIKGKNKWPWGRRRYQVLASDLAASGPRASVSDSILQAASNESLRARRFLLGLSAEG